jgi:glucokinase
MKLSIGTDIGGTNTSSGVVAPDGTVLARNTFPTADYADGRAYAARLAESVRGLMANSEGDWLGLGIGAPNGNMRTGCIEHAANLRFKNCPLVAHLQEELDLPTIFLTNDANAAASGEKIYGGARGFEDFVMITLGTGLGSGIYVRNELVTGHNGVAGELGHMSVIPEGRYGGFGRRGSLENYCSATGIRRTFFEMIAQRGAKTALDGLAIGDINSKIICDAAYAGDPTCKATIDFTGRLLGEAMASAALVTDPAAFFLFGGPVQAGNILIDTVRKAFENHLIPSFKGHIQILVSELPPGDAAILGAAALVL